ncbi:MAG: alpha-L-fucosidase [Verrucomicrobia bacterium]|nr:alpha-L-fucosidase [Verrucomicrobiota bacterium]
MRKSKSYSALLACAILLPISVDSSKASPVDAPPQGQARYTDSYESLKNYTAPEWFEDAKIGFWVHWGVYSVPAFKGDHAAEWYGRWMYATGQNGEKRGLATNRHHEETYGNPAVFGYKDFIPMFKAEKFDAKEWADLCVRGGAKFFCMMGAHHDNFALWNTKFSRFNSVQMGPKRDLVGEIEKAVRARGLKFGVSNHSGWNPVFFQYNFLNKADAMDPQWQDLYGNPVIEGKKVRASERDLNRWLERTKELCDLYKPDLYYFDWDINGADFESRRIEFAAHYYNKGIEWGVGRAGAPGVVMTYKNKAFPAGSAVFDHERGKENKISPMVWQTDDSIFDGHNWSYVENTPIKPANTIIDGLVDIVSKRGVLMLSFGPKADGTFPDDQKHLMLAIGDWLKINGEAIYATRPWITFGEGSIRFTRDKSKPVLYATLLDWPKDKAVNIQALNSTVVDKSEIQSITMVGVTGELEWEQDATALKVTMPSKKPGYDHAFPLKIVFKTLPGIKNQTQEK